MPTPADQTRRTALACSQAPQRSPSCPLASIPTTILADLIEAHRGARAAFCEARDAGSRRARRGNPSGYRRPISVKSHRHEDRKPTSKTISLRSSKNGDGFGVVSRAGEQAQAVLEARKAFCLARLDEVFAGYAIAETAYNAASAAEDDAVTAICASRCATLEEVAVKCQICLRGTIKDEIQTEHYDALLGSFLSEAEDIR